MERSKHKFPYLERAAPLLPLREQPRILPLFPTPMPNTRWNPPPLPLLQQLSKLALA